MYKILRNLFLKRTKLLEPVSEVSSVLGYKVNSKINCVPKYKLSIIGKQKFKDVTIYNGFQTCLGVNGTEHVQRPCAGNRRCCCQESKIEINDTTDYVDGFEGSCSEDVDSPRSDLHV